MMDTKTRSRMHLSCLYDMFRDKIEENVIYIVYTENDGKIDTTIDQLMSIAACSFTGHLFEPQDTKIASTQFTYTTNSGQSITHSLNESLENITAESRTITKQKKLGTNAADDSRESRSSPQDTTTDAVYDLENGGDADIDEQIERLQNSIDDLLLEKKSSHDKASQYLTRKMFPVTSYYSELGSQIRRMIEEKTNKLVDLLLKKSQNSDSVDLHGLNPVQARLVVSELLKTRQRKLLIDKQGEASVDIITGWGKHSVNHQGQRIRTTIVALLREKGFEYHRLNKGALRVTIRRF